MKAKRYRWTPVDNNDQMVSVGLLDQMLLLTHRFCHQKSNNQMETVGELNNVRDEALKATDMRRGHCRGALSPSPADDWRHTSARSFAATKR